jgi:hypothetical protein
MVPKAGFDLGPFPSHQCWRGFRLIRQVLSTA